MSRGLGKMQRMIIESLDESRRWMGDVQTMRLGPYTMVQGRYRDHKPEEGLPYAIRVNGKIVYLCDGQYDLAATMAFLAEKRGFEKLRVAKEITSHITGDSYPGTISRFSDNFWKSARHLIQAGYLIRVCEKSNRIVSKTGKLRVPENTTSCNNEDS